MSGVGNLCRQGQSNRSSIDSLIPNHTQFPAAALAVVCKVMKDRLPGGQHHRDRVLADDLEDLSRFEGEGGREAPVPTGELIDLWRVEREP